MIRLKHVVCAILLVAANSVLFAQIPNDYIAYWSFDQTISEVPDISSDPTITNTYGLDRFQNDNGALYFDGDDNIIYNPTPTELLNLPSGDYSISLWLKDTNEPVIHTILSAYNAGTGYILRTHVGTFGREIALYENGIGSQARSDDGIIPEQWQHVAMTFDNTTKQVKLYVDGLEVAYKSNTVGSGTYGNDGFNFQLGAIPTNVHPMVGAIDDLYIFDRVLTNEELTALASDGAGSGDENGLVANWPLYEDANDLGPNGLNGTVVGNSPNAGQYEPNGTDDYIDLSNPFALGNLPLNDFNFSAWIRPGEGTNRTIYSSYTSLAGWYVSSIPHETEGRTIRFVVYYNGGHDTFKPEVSFAIDEWTHLSVNYIVATRSLEIFINGTESPVSQVTSGTPGAYNSASLADKSIGAFGDGSAPYLGALKDIYLYNRALTESEIQNLYGVHAPSQSLWQVAGTNAEGGTDIYYHDGNVAIGNPVLPVDNTYSLVVEGKVLSREVKVSAQEWYDVVFEEDYNLRSLQEIESFIEAHHHLPDIPSEADVKAEGIELGEMNGKLLQKIEELTLHMIQMNKRLEALEEENKMLKASAKK